MDGYREARCSSAAQKVFTVSRFSPNTGVTTSASECPSANKEADGSCGRSNCPQLAVELVALRRTEVCSDVTTCWESPPTARLNLTRLI